MKKNGLVLQWFWRFAGGDGAGGRREKTDHKCCRRHGETIEGELVLAVEAMPEDKFGFAAHEWRVQKACGRSRSKRSTWQQ